MATLGCFYIYMALNLGLQRTLSSEDKVCFSSTDYYFFVECLWNLLSALCEKVADTIQNMSYQTKSNGTKNLSDNTFVIEPKFRELGLFSAMDKKLVGQSFHNRAGISRMLADMVGQKIRQPELFAMKSNIRQFCPMNSLCTSTYNFSFEFF